MPKWIGDYIMALSVVEQAAREQRKVSFYCITPTHLLNLHSALSALPVLPCTHRNPRAEELEAIRAANFEQLFLLPRSFSTAWFGRQTRIAHRRGLATECRGLLLTARLPAATRTLSAHLTVEYAQVLQCPWQPPQEFRSPLPPPSDRQEYVVFCPGAAYGPAKRWPYFAQLAALLNRPIVVLGGTDAQQEGVAIAAIRPDGVDNRVGATTLVEALAVVRQAAVVVSNDSGLMHLAAYAGTPVLGLFGSSSPVWTRPLGPHVRILHAPQPCSPCLRRTCRFGHYRCLAQIEAEGVGEVVEELAGGGAS